MPLKTCKARCRTDLEDTMIHGGRFDHDHVEEEEEGTDMQTEGSCRTLTKQPITRSVNMGNSASTL